MNHTELGLLIARNCYKEDTYTPWGSRAISFDRRILSTNPALLDEIAHHLIKLLPNDISLLIGNANGGVPLTQAFRRNIQIPITILQKDDQNNLVVGHCNEYRGWVATLVDDTLCKGSRIVEASNLLNQLGITIKNVLCVIARGTIGIANLRERNITTLSLFTGEELARYRSKNI